MDFFVAAATESAATGFDPKTLVIPLIAALVGWFTNVVAVKMMFYPIEFVGIKEPYLGWQGIIPRNAMRLARKSLQLITNQLLKVPDLFQEFDPKSFVERNSQDIDEMTRKLLDEKAAKYAPGMWGALAPAVKDQVYTLVRSEVHSLSEKTMADARDSIDDLLDIENVVTAAVAEERSLIGQIFYRVGTREFKFIERSGAYFGFVFGLIQFAVWLVYPAWWILPFFGFLVGYATNWLALKLIFDPKEPINIGKIVIQGLFHRRQKQISKEFSDIISKKVLTSEALFAQLSKGESREKLLAIVDKHSRAVLEKYKKHPLAAGLLTEEVTANIEEELKRDVEAAMFREGGMIADFVDKADEIRETLSERMAEMDPEGFENVLRPAFKQDEWKLILAGAVLGLAAGFIQLTTLFADQS